ncbi:type II toxin-antitoxin system antitoxin CcdA [Pectobacterium carotovorum]|uniref:type II toxin-antitoxin system antitoxin CcdA n=1 Tax=Pectobacterium carotovorum TaxID=554 RepID=UPI00057C4F6D|nr:type II toxin-antitoxin system antitoxin CcdA [Pectobacterium carotovorum]KHT36302.1 pirin [Pectobacterium carotovorum subsp. carotovorum]MBA0178811.1 type II toxin-antitoxin system antitoxin CcdA [Pectobacterium carotovorum]MBA0194186.1 type II toxin-antitoxin system antitoxin CcdA [Pectobacterium carotovorum]MBA0200774.1 type II toxin-antitoxin system antitoxin CcdA [Pectobacterium carotovorum]
MKRRISIAVDKDDYQVLSTAAIPISGLVDDVISTEAHRIKTEVWKKENREGMEEVARFIAKHSSFADENRNW